MELEFTPDQDDLRDSIRAVLQKESPVSLARAVVEHDERPDALWSTMVDLGWPALTIPEADGGIGLGMLELAILAEELGRVIAPGPLINTSDRAVTRQQDQKCFATSGCHDTPGGRHRGTPQTSAPVGVSSPVRSDAAYRTAADRARRHTGRLPLLRTDQKPFTGRAKQRKDPDGTHARYRGCSRSIRLN